MPGRLDEPELANRRTNRDAIHQLAGLTVGGLLRGHRLTNVHQRENPGGEPGFSIVDDRARGLCDRSSDTWSTAAGPDRPHPGALYPQIIGLAMTRMPGWSGSGASAAKWKSLTISRFAHPSFHSLGADAANARQSRFVGRPRPGRGAGCDRRNGQTRRRERLPGERQCRATVIIFGVCSPSRWSASKLSRTERGRNPRPDLSPGHARGACRCRRAYAGR